MDKNKITFAQAIEGYLLDAEARRLSHHTINDYLNTFRKFTAYIDRDPPIEAITAQDIRGFLASREVSRKTVRNYHAGLSALWTWALAAELVDEHVVHKVQRPARSKTVIVPYSRDDVKAMLASIEKSKPYTRPGKRESDHSLPNAERNKAIILLLLDTGIRSSELCNLRIHQADLKNRRVKVFGKGSKERIIPFSPQTGQAIWRYLATRKDEKADAHLFVTNDGRKMSRDRLFHQLQTIGQRAGVEDAGVHRFRHTFAINYLRNGGDPWSLQMMLGHSTLEMVRNYLSIVQADLDESHRQASPVANWRL